MFGILILVAIYVILGFMLAWVAGMVAQEEEEVKTGVLTLVCAGAINWVIGFVLADVMEPGVPRMMVAIGTSYLVLALCLLAIARLGWKPSLIIAAIYQALLYLVFYVLLA